MSKIKRTYAGQAASERQEVRKLKLIQAGLQLFGTHGYANTSIKAVCQSASLSERYFYESFENKEALLIGVYNHLIDQLREGFLQIAVNTETTNYEKVHDSLTLFYSRLRDDPYRARVQLFEVLGVSDKVTQIYQEVKQELMVLILQFIDNMSPDSDLPHLDRQILATAISGAIQQVGEDWVLSDYEEPLDKIVASLLFLFETTGNSFIQRQSEV